MRKIIHQITRMCISCRERHAQNELIRLQYIDATLLPYSKKGRSFYLCSTCILDEKKVSKSLMRYCRSNEKDKLMNKLKEIITDDRKS